LYLWDSFGAPGGVFVSRCEARENSVLADGMLENTVRAVGSKGVFASRCEAREDLLSTNPIIILRS